MFVEKMVCDSNKKVSYEVASEFASSSQSSKIVCSSCQRPMVARTNIDQIEAAVLFRPLSYSTYYNPADPIAVTYIVADIFFW